MISGTETCAISFGGDEIYDVVARQDEDTRSWTYEVRLPPDPFGAVVTITAKRSAEVPKDADPEAQRAMALAQAPETWATLGECLADAMRFAVDHHTGIVEVEEA